MDLYNIRGQLNRGKSIYDIPMRVTFYARVSTEKDEQLHSLQSQVQYYSDFIRGNPNWEYIDGYTDEGLSGTSVAKREQFLRMVDDAKLDKFDFIVTKEISRFSRNTMDSIKYTQDLLAAGVGVLFQSDNINTLYPDSELRLTIMSSIAQDEVRKISERVKFGFKRSIEKGVVLGNNKIWGYKKDNGKLVILEEEAELVRLVFDLYVNQSIGIRTIANTLTERGYRNGNGNGFSFSTIKGILSNPKYKGYYCGNKTHKYDYRRNDRRVMESTEWVMYKDHDTVPPIVDEQIWDRANAILRQRSEKMASENKAGYANRYSYSAKIICMEHKTPYHRTEFKYKSGTREAWRCKKYAEQGKAMCASPTIYTDELDDIMRQVMEDLTTDKARIIHKLIQMYSDVNVKSSLKEDVAKVQVEINKILSMKDKLLDLSIKGRIDDDEFESRNNKFNAEIAELKQKVEEYQRQSEKNEEFKHTVEIFRSAIANELSFEEVIGEGSIGSLLDRIEVYKTKEKNVVELKIFLKVVDTSVDCSIKRQRGKASSSTVFRSAPYTRAALKKARQLTQ